MVNSKDFIKRLENIIEFYGLSASSFAEKVGVQRSSISHILSGRNKPSLEFVMKILSSCPEVDLYWLLNGKGNFPREDFKTNSEIDEKLIPEGKNLILKNKSVLTTPHAEIERIVIFYKDGSFKNFENS
ncbi:MAG: helix-turn-helix transcriptional regulator [Flavobacteriaceae bacterium]|nr:helix-turn-helix domain-containing protein [Bacteroidia bacterium]NNK83492.1 helix-turn-helix transcriptional regulator [Flavobacteriaceae bacterium]